MKHADGTRYELNLTSSEGATRAVYDAVVATPERERRAVVAITPTEATLLEGAEGLDADATRQLLALARTLGRRADEAPWPRKINRWRKPGVR